jgi:hypothetical protein
MTTDWKTRLAADLAAADARIERGRDEMAAGGDERARAITAAVVARQQELGGERGSKRKAVADVAAALDTTLKSIDVALAKVNAGLPARPGLPWPVWDRLAAAELAGIAPLPPLYWQVLAHLVRGIAFDEAWADAPGELLAQEVEDVDPDELPAGVEQTLLAQACRSWSRAAGLAVLEALTNGERTMLPIEGTSPDGLGDAPPNRLGPKERPEWAR